MNGIQTGGLGAYTWVERRSSLRPRRIKIPPKPPLTAPTQAIWEKGQWGDLTRPEHLRPSRRLQC